MLVDTNIWLASFDRDSKEHGPCSQLLASHAAELATTALVVAEAGWFLLDRLGPDAQARLVSLVSSGALRVIDLNLDDWVRVGHLTNQYRDLRLDVVDASLMAVAERLNESEIATLDERDFRAVRPRHCDYFVLLPADGRGS